MEYVVTLVAVVGISLSLLFLAFRVSKMQREIDSTGEAVIQLLMMNPDLDVQREGKSIHVTIRPIPKPTGE